MRMKSSLFKPAMKFGLLAAGILTISACSISFGSTEAENGQLQPQIKTVKVEKIAKQKVGDTVEAAGDVLSSIQMKVSAKSGGDVVEVLKKRGDTVEQGEVLLRLASKDLQFQRDAAVSYLKIAVEELKKTKHDGQVALSQLNKSLDEAKKNINKLRNDFDLGLAAEEDLADAQAGLKDIQNDINAFRQQQNIILTASEAKVRDAQFDLQEVEQALEDLEVKAPASGLLTEMRADLGMTLPAGTEIALIENLNSVKIIVKLTEEGVKFVRGKGELAYYTADDPARRNAKVRFLSEVMDPESNTYELMMEEENKNRQLKPGMKIRVQLTSESDQYAVAVPTQSIIREGDHAHVFVLEGDTVKKRNLELGRLNEPVQEVLSGVTENEWLVVSGQRQLNDLEKVQAQKVEKK